MRQLADFAAFRAHQILTLQTVLHHFFGCALGDVFKSILVLLAGGFGSRLFLGFLLCTGFRFVEQETQLLHSAFGNLLRGCSELLMPGKAQRLHENRNLLLQFGDAPALSLELLIFRPGNGDYFRVTCLEIFRTFHALIIPYFS